jgi:plastocyanin
MAAGFVSRYVCRIDVSKCQAPNVHAFETPSVANLFRTWPTQADTSTLEAPSRRQQFPTQWYITLSNLLKCIPFSSGRSIITVHTSTFSSFVPSTPKRASLFQTQPTIMLYSTLFAATALVGAATAVDHKVSVSDKSGALIFMPDSIVAAQGDTVSYHFWPKNHSVAQSTFAEPCAPMANGFWSGYVATASMDAAAKEVFTYEVKNASAPIWFYCTQGKHCQGGMVGVINPP